jgi:UDP-N-acetyl-2-amino-2-deoxyglucuronate dehydrogenase
VNVALIGCGHVASLHAEVYRVMDDLKVVAVADCDYGKAKLFAHKYAIDRATSDYFEILKDKDIDFVDICTPTSTHAEISCNVAKSGHHILLEKPMALNVEECNRIINEAKKSGIKLCLVHNNLFLPSVRLLKQMVDTGRYDVASLRTSYKISKSQSEFPKWVLTSEEKGILWELGCHLAYLQLAFLKDVREVHAWARKFKFPVYDKIGALIGTPETGYGVLEISAISKQREFIMEMDSSDGTRVKIDLDKNTYMEMPEKSEKTGNKLLSSMQKLVKNKALARKKNPGSGYSIGHFELISEFVESLKCNTLPPVPPEDGREAIRLLSCIEKRLTENPNS